MHQIKSHARSGFIAARKLTGSCVPITHEGYQLNQLLLLQPCDDASKCFLRLHTPSQTFVDSRAHKQLINDAQHCHGLVEIKSDLKG